MFTGIVECLGTVKSWERSQGKAQVAIEPDKTLDGQIGDSYSVNGCCLTLVSRTDTNTLWFDLGAETLEIINWEKLLKSQRVHLERALEMGGRLGGHMVSGHIDKCVKVMVSEETEGGWLLTCRVPAEYRGLVALKGSVCFDGVSLTVNSLKERRKAVDVSVLLIPETLKATRLGHLQVGELCNFEADLIAKHLGRLVEARNIEAEFGKTS